jgi:peroxiredoxin family protein
MSLLHDSINVNNRIYIFFDANSLLNFYQLEPKYIKLIERQIDFKSFRPILTGLVIDEYQRNRAKILRETLSSVDLKPIKCNLFEEVNGYTELNEAAKRYNILYTKFKIEFENQKFNKTLAADIFIKKIIDNALVFDHTKEIYDKATEKYNLGYPPGKGTRYNDMIHWLTLMDGMVKYNKKILKNEIDKTTKPPIQKIYLCTEDYDFLDHEEYLNLEWKEKTNTVIEFIGLKNLNKNIIPKIDKQTEKALSTLSELNQKYKEQLGYISEHFNSLLSGDDLKKAIQNLNPSFQLIIEAQNNLSSEVIKSALSSLYIKSNNYRKNIT